MPYIKEIIMRGFKSFARETRIPFKNTMNVIVGPNGSGKSNITDAICFVLGRLGSKSMRARRLSNLIFAGTPKYKPASEASVEMIFDNSDKGFSYAEKEISIKRILRKNGQGIYKIHNEIKTRQEILELLAQAGIDPNGFNIILQGEIDAFVKMPPDNRREVIEEVAGISIYELRKQRSLNEMEKTEVKLKEISATLRERRAFLKNLEEERKQALKYKKFQQDIQSYKASILNRTVFEKKTKLNEIDIQIEKKFQEITKINNLISKDNQEIVVLNEKINHIINDIQKSTGIEQEKLNKEISDLRADLAGLSIKKSSLENQINETKARKGEIKQTIARLEQEILDLNSFKGKKKRSLKSEIDEKKKKLEEIDDKKRKFYVLKSNLASLNSRIDDKKRQMQKSKNEYDFIFSRIQEIESGINIKESIEHQKENLAKIKPVFDSLKKEIDQLRQIKTEKEKTMAVLERQIQELEKIKQKVSSLDTCPLCKTKMTKEHVRKVIEESFEKQAEYKKDIEHSGKEIKESEKKLEKAGADIEKIENELKTRSQDILRLELINEKKQSLKRLSEEQKVLEKEYEDIESKRQGIEKHLLSLKTSEESYDSLRLEVQELERQEEKNVGIDITLKQRDVERMRNTLRQASREIEEAESDLEEVTAQFEEKQNNLDEKNEQDEFLKRKFRKTLDEKSGLQGKIRFFESDISHKQSDKYQAEMEMNNFKISRAEISAQKESAEIELSAFKDAKIIRLSIQELKIKLEQTQQILNTLGTVNLRSLEVYEGVKSEYDKIQEKADILLKEKQEILKIIEDIDKKKKKVFLQTLTEINKLFSRNFSQLSTKGEAMLEPVNKEDIFAGGIEMLIKVGKGKYFDTHSLSGGEKSLVSLSLIFAIQEYKPYSFYIFDEIDAALDRRNSERLATLLKKYMKNGQYIIITHNDSLITEAPTIYGVSMQDKISNVVSLEV